jgi:hypothetical protein
LMNGVLSSDVCAMTQTPASGPRALATTPLMKPSAGRLTACALALHHTADAPSAATQAAIRPLRQRLDLFMHIP